MKKFLALVLALVMTMSLVTISAGAEFTDADEVTYTEAVDVMTALEVVGGDASGAFNPTAGLSRGAAAKIICNMILGPDVAGSLVAETAPFSDVAVDNVYAGYIAYCYEEGIISGYPNGTFQPYAPLNGYAFLKMLLGALGYDADVEGFNTSNYAINVAKLAKQRNLVEGNEDYVGSKPLTREEAMLFAFNTLMSTTVVYDGGSNSTITIGDVVIKNTGKATYTVNGGVVAGSDYFYKTNFATKLGLDASSTIAVGTDGKADITSLSTDSFKRAAHKWYNSNTTKTPDTLIGAYAATPDYTFVSDKAYAAISGDTTVLAGLKDKTDNDDLSIESTTTFWVNGVTKAANSREIAVGDVVEVYLTTDTDEIANVVVTRYALAKINVAKAAANAKDSKNETYAYNVSSAAGASFATVPCTDLPGYDEATYVKDAFIAVAVGTSSAVLDSYVPEYVTGAATAYASTAITLDGTKYSFVGSSAGYNPNSLNQTNIDWEDGEYGVWVDENGYALGLKTVSGTAALTDVYYVNDVWTEADTAFGNTATKVYAQAVALDGTIAKFEIGFDAGTVLTNSTNAQGYYTKSGNVYTQQTSAGNADGTSKYYLPTAAVGDVVTFAMNSTTKVYDVTDFNNAANSTYYVGVNGTETLDSDSTRTSTQVYTGKVAYLTADTKFVVLEEDGADLEARVVSGAVKVTSASAAVIATKDANGNYLAAYVVIDLASEYTGAVNADDYLYVKTASTTYVGSGKYSVEVYNMKGEKSTITATTAGANNTFFEVAIDADGVYTLTAVSVSRADTLSISSPYLWDEETGVAYDETFDGIYNTLLSVAGNYKEIESKDAVVVDLRDTTVTGAYASVVSSVADIVIAADTLKTTTPSDTYYAVTMDMYVAEDGVAVIFVTNIA